MTSIRLLSANTYLIPSFMTGNECATCVNQDIRAERLGKLCSVHRPDVIMLQEMWGSSMSQLERSLLSSDEQGYKILEGYKSMNFGTMVDSVFQRFSQRGGLWSAFRPSTLNVYTAFKHVYTSSNTRSAKGAMAVLYKVNHQNTTEHKKSEKENRRIHVDSDKEEHNRWMLVFNTHFDPTNDNNSQIKQMDELNDFIKSTVAAVTPIVETDLCDKSFLNCNVLLVGDFNIHDGSSLYDDLIQKLHLRDLFVDHLKQTNTSKRSEEYHTYDEANSLCMYEPGRIDYVFSVKNVGKCHFPEIIVDNFEILKQREGEEISDHWPLLIELKIV